MEKSFNSQFIFTDKYLKFKEIEYFIHFIKFEMWLALFYINSFYFQQWISNWDIAFFNSSLDSKSEFLNAGLIHKNLIHENWDVIVALVGLLNFFQYMKEMEYWDFWMLG